MKLADIYRENKGKYDKYIIMIKCGYFYEIYGEEANGGNWLEGHRFSSNPSDSDIEEWANSLKG